MKLVIKNPPPPAPNDPWAGWLWEWVVQVVNGKKIKLVKKKKKKKKGGRRYKKDKDPPGPPGGGSGGASSSGKKGRTHGMALRPSKVPKGGYRVRWPSSIDPLGRMLWRGLVALATRTLLFMFFLRAQEDEAEAEGGGYVYEDEYKSAWDESDAEEWDGEFKT